MAIADKYGPGDGECIALARMASQAVDFVKTGVAVPSQEIPVIEEYPDFMGKVAFVFPRIGMPLTEPFCTVTRTTSKYECSKRNQSATIQARRF